jgi:hypothetical protein
MSAFEPISARQPSAASLISQACPATDGKGWTLPANPRTLTAALREATLHLDRQDAFITATTEDVTRDSIELGEQVLALGDELFAADGEEGMIGCAELVLMGVVAVGSGAMFAERSRDRTRPALQSNGRRSLDPD